MKLSAAHIQAFQEKERVMKTPLVGEYTAKVKEVKAMVFKKSGAFGLKVTYQISQGDMKGRQVNEYIAIRKADGTEYEYANDKLITRLKAFGKSEEEIATFEIPETHTELGDLIDLQGSTVLLKCEASTYNGNPSTEIKRVKRA